MSDTKIISVRSQGAIRELEEGKSHQDLVMFYMREPAAVAWDDAYIDAQVALWYVSKSEAQLIANSLAAYLDIRAEDG